MRIGKSYINLAYLFRSQENALHMNKVCLALLLLVAVLAIASASETDSGLPEVDPLDYIEGEIITAGSSTVFPLSERMAELWTDAGGVAPSIASIGSGAGFERFCVEGETDISNASRAIKDSERESCAEIGRDPIEFRVGTDALAVTVSAENDFGQRCHYGRTGAALQHRRYLGRRPRRMAE